MRCQVRGEEGGSKNEKAVVTRSVNLEVLWGEGEDVQACSHFTAMIHLVCFVWVEMCPTAFRVQPDVLGTTVMIINAHFQLASEKLWPLITVTI